MVCKKTAIFVLVSSAALGGVANAQHDDLFHPVFRTPTKAIGVKVRPPVIDGRFALIEVVSISLNEETKGRFLSRQTLAIDCKERGLKTITIHLNADILTSSTPRWVGGSSSEISSSFDLRTLRYETVEDREVAVRPHSDPESASALAFEERVIVGAVCETVATGANFKDVASRFSQTGGVRDLKELSCEVGRGHTVTVRFSDALGAVQVGNSWLLPPLGRVTPGSIMGSVDRLPLVVDRVSGRIEIGDTIRGTCEAVAPGTRKF